MAVGPRAVKNWMCQSCEAGHDLLLRRAKGRALQLRLACPGRLQLLASMSSVVNQSSGSRSLSPWAAAAGDEGSTLASCLAAVCPEAGHDPSLRDRGGSQSCVVDRGSGPSPSSLWAAAAGDEGSTLATSLAAVCPDAGYDVLLRSASGRVLLLRWVCWGWLLLRTCREGCGRRCGGPVVGWLCVPGWSW
jgi:hypothetical protein